MSLFSKQNQYDEHDISGLRKLKSNINSMLAGGAHVGMEDADLAGRMAMESASLDAAERSRIDNTFDTIYKSLIAMEAADIQEGARPNVAKRTAAKAAAIAGLVASGLNRYIKHDPFAKPIEAPAGAVVVHNYMGAHSTPRVAYEAYDESEIRNSVLSSTALNYRAARQNAVGEMFFPTVVMSPDQVGFHVHLDQVNVMREVRRKVGGRLQRYFDRVNLVKASIDPTILVIDDTDGVPVRTVDSEDFFVDPTDFAPYKYNLNGVGFETSYLKMGIEADLLALTENEAISRTGVLNETDAIDPAVMLDGLLLKVDNQTIALDNLKYLTTANFVPAPQGDSRAMLLAFNSQMLPLNKDTKKADGSNLTGALANISTNEYVVRLRLNVNGNLNVQDAIHNLSAAPVTVHEIRDKDGNRVDTTAGTGKTVADAFKGAELIGYRLKFRRVNSNKRSRGMLIDMSSHSILYAVPLLGPVTARRPLAKGDEHNEADLHALITTVRTWTSLKAIETLFDIKALLASYATDRKMGSDVDTEFLGISRKLIQPYFEADVLDVKKVVATLKSEDRPLQVQAVIVNKIRDMVFRAWYQSGLGVAAEHVFGGEAPLPIVKIACDPVIARYLQVQGDLRTIGGKFDVQIEASWDARMQDNMFITLAYETAETEANFHPLSFGMMLWRPEVVITAPIYADGQTSRELTVQPSFLHVCNTPILTFLEIKNIKEAMVDMVAINQRVVP